MRYGPRIYKHPDGRWEARYRKGRRADGRILYGSAYGATREEAEKRRAELLQEMARLAEEGASAEAAIIDQSNQGLREYYAAVPKSRSLYPDPLTDAELECLLPRLWLCRQSIRLALLLSLYLGVSGDELAAMRYSDVDREKGVLNVRRYMIDAKYQPGSILSGTPRSVVIPRAAWRHPELERLVREGGDRYLLTDAEAPVKSLRAARLLLKKQLDGAVEGKTVTPEVLRATFVRRCLAGGINVETVARVTGLPTSALRSKYGHYSAADPTLLDRIEYPDQPSGERQPRQMNLLILGAGSHGHAVYEIAEKTGIFQRIAFLDDQVVGEHVIGRLEDCERYRQEYPMCFIAIGNNQKRRALAARVTAAGFLTPRLVSTETSIARGVRIGRGSVVMPQATVNAGAEIGEFCIVASNALIGFNATVDSFVHCDCASVVMRDCSVQEAEMIESGEIVKRGKAE